MESGAGLLLAGKFVLVLGAEALAAQRDFALVPRLGRAFVEGQDPAHVLRRIAWVDRLVLLLAVAIAYLGVAGSPALGPAGGLKPTTRRPRPARNRCTRRRRPGGAGYRPFAAAHPSRDPAIPPPMSCHAT